MLPHRTDSSCRPVTRCAGEPVSRWAPRTVVPMTEAAGRQDPASPPRGSVAVVTLGCARNEVDSEELAGRLAEQGWQLTADPVDADVAVVNTCGFIAQAKKDSIDALLEAADLKERGRTRAVVARCV